MIYLQERMLLAMGFPLWSVGRNAKGFFALGFFSKGVFSLGCFTLGGISVSMASLGLLFLGAFSRGRFFAYGDDTKALVALASTKAEGTWAELLPLPSSKAEALYLTLKDNIPSRLSWTMGIVKKLLGL